MWRTKNIVIESRYAEGKPDRLPALAAELVRLKVDVIVTAGAASNPRRQASNSYHSHCHDERSRSRWLRICRQSCAAWRKHYGLVHTFAGVKRKTTGASGEIVPKLSRVAVFGNSTQPGNAQALKETEGSAAPLKVQVTYLDILAAKDIEPTFHEAKKGRADAVLLLQSAVLNSQRKQTADLATKSRLPTIYYAPEFLESGGLMSYASSINDLYRRAAIYVDKILKGSRPAELPVEQPTKFEFMVNLKAANQIGLTIPPNVLTRADKVIR